MRLVRSVCATVPKPERKVVVETDGLAGALNMAALHSSSPSVSMHTFAPTTPATYHPKGQDILRAVRSPIDLFCV